MFRTRFMIAGLATAFAVLPAGAAQAGARPGVVLQIERGGKAISVVTAGGRTERIKLGKALPKGVRVGSRIALTRNTVSAVRGVSKAVKLRATVAGQRGRFTAVLPGGASVASVVPNIKLDLAGLSAGKAVSVRVRFLSNGTAVATVAPPGDYSDPYADPFTDPYVDPIPSTDPAQCEAAATPVKLISVNRSTLRIMVQDAAGARTKYKVPADVFATLQRGLDVVVSDKDSDGTAEAVTVVGKGARKGHPIVGTVDWIDSDWGAFGLADRSGRVRVVNASACQLASIAEGDEVSVTAHRDTDGELVADVIEQGTGPASGEDDDSGDDDGEGSDHGDDGEDDGQEAGSSVGAGLDRRGGGQRQPIPFWGSFWR